MGAPKPSSRTRGMGPMVRDPSKFRGQRPRAILPPHRPHVHLDARLTATTSPTLTTPNLPTTPTISPTTSCPRGAFPPSLTTSSPTPKQPSPTPNQRTRAKPPSVGSQRGRPHEAHQGAVAWIGARHKEKPSPSRKKRRRPGPMGWTQGPDAPRKRTPLPTPQGEVRCL